MESPTGKSITTSVPTIAIKFYANAEQIEEVYKNDDEPILKEKSLLDNENYGASGTGSTSTEGSPLKWARLVRGASCTENPDVETQSDAWRFFSDIKGKIAKSVEEKITEIKSRNQDEGSPSKKLLSKENSSLSDSEELSESSLSRTCGLGSTTEGVEMSSDDESLEISSNIVMEKIKKPTHRFRFQKSSKSANSITKDGTISITNLTKLYSISADAIEEAFPLPELENETAVEAVEEAEDATQPSAEKEEMVLKLLSEKYSNIKLDDDNILNIKEVSGNDIDKESVPKNTVYAPVGFFDFRFRQKNERKAINKLYLLSVLPLVVTLCYCVHNYSPCLGGIIYGFLIATAYYYFITGKLIPISNKIVSNNSIWKVQAIKEHTPLVKYEGWMNELPDHYNPHTYHICQTQSVYLRLQGNLLKISNTSHTKVPKRAVWNQPEIKATLTYNRVYNLTGAKVSLLPEGLTHIRLWSKKYPICVTLDDQMKFEDDRISEKSKEEVKEENPPVAPVRKSSAFTFRKKPVSSSFPTSQRFSQLKDQENSYLDAEISRSHTPSPDSSEEIAVEPSILSPITLKPSEDQQVEEIDDDSLTDGWSHCTVDVSPTETKLYLFGRTDREKEDWFRKFVLATRIDNEDKAISQISGDSVSALKETDYENYMNNILKQVLNKPEESMLKEPNLNVAWINALMGRVLFDCMCDDNFSVRVRERIQRKLHAIRLPYFIEELSVVELNLGCTPPIFKSARNPEIDERGLWIDIDMCYEGSAVLTLMTKLNLMRLKQPPVNEKEVKQKTAMYHSDVDDSAESSTDDESSTFLPNVVATEEKSGAQPPSKKFLKMVDRITESKFFQAATENKYIKKAMEGVSNTDLRLKVEVRSIEGTLVINIPPPPSDRVWIGFRPVPELILSAHPIVGERNITLMHITSWIEKKLVQEFQKALVVPNMEDLVIPIMMSKLP